MLPPATGRATDVRDADVPAPSLPPKPASVVPLPRLLVGVAVLGVLLYFHPTLRDEVRYSIVGALTLSAVAHVAGAIWRSGERGLVTGLILSGILASQIYFYLAAVGTKSVEMFFVPLIGIALLLCLPPLLGYLAGKYREEAGASDALRRAEPRWSVGILALSSLALVLSVGMGGSPPKPSSVIAPLAPVPLVAAPDINKPAQPGTFTASYQDLRVLPAPTKTGTFYMGDRIVAMRSGDTLITQAQMNEPNGYSNTHGFVWTKETGYVDLNKTYPELRHLNQVVAASDDASVLHVRYNSPAMSGESIWIKGRGLQTNLTEDAADWVRANPVSADKTYGGNYGTIHGISGDGRVVVLSSGTSLLRWTQNSGFDRVVEISQGGNITVRAVSHSGNAITGHNGKNAFVWSNKHGMQEIPRIEGTTGAVAFGVSSDGEYVTGASDNFLFRWTKRGGLENLGRLPGDFVVGGGGMGISQHGYTISDNGKIVVGMAGYIPFVWSEKSGVLPLREVLASTKSNMATAQVAAASVTPDGKEIAGVSGGQNNLHRWRLILR